MSWCIQSIREAGQGLPSFSRSTFSATSFCLEVEDEDATSKSKQWLGLSNRSFTAMSKMTSARRDSVWYFSVTGTVSISQLLYLMALKRVEDIPVRKGFSVKPWLPSSDVHGATVLALNL
jgi:hypothetical protein